MTASEEIEAALAVLERYGWCKLAFHATPDDTRPKCLTGALMWVQQSVTGLSELSPPLSRPYLAAAIKELFPERAGDYGRLGPSIVWFNDDMRTTYGDVRAVALRALELARADGQ